jgi:hypothetical protein
MSAMGRPIYCASGRQCLTAYSAKAFVDDAFSRETGGAEVVQLTLVELSGPYRGTCDANTH